MALTRIIYVCVRCGATYPLDATAWRCTCGGAFMLPLGPRFTERDVDRKEPSLWRYAAALPISRGSARAYFGEGMTSLVERPWGGRTLAFKLDYLLPTGSYKDRGSAIMINALAAAGVKALHEDSSGNAGASIAAYAAAADMRCTVYVPASSSAGKRVQIVAAGADLVMVEGAREDAALAAQTAAGQGSIYASHNWNPLFIEGVKTLAYELWEQHGFKAPDAVIAPLGYGSIVLALARGFAELHRAGAIQRLPRIYGCQAERCAPLYRAFLAGDLAAARLDPAELRPTVAEGITASNPVRPAEILDSIVTTGGRVVTVSEEAIFRALCDLARLGLYVEPTAAVAPAAAREPLGRHLATVERICIILTGSGLKATDTLTNVLKKAEGGRS